MRVGQSGKPSLVNEAGSDDTFWNSQVMQAGVLFSVHVFDADGDCRLDREESFAEKQMAIASADRSIQRASQ